MIITLNMEQVKILGTNRKNKRKYIRETFQKIYTETQNQKSLDGRKLLKIVDDYRKFIIKYKLENSKSKQYYNKARQKIMSNKQLDKDSVNLILNYNREIIKNIDVKLENKKSTVVPIAISISIYAAFIIIKRALKMASYALNVLLLYWTSKVLTTIYGMILFPIHAFLSICWNFLKFVVGVKREGIQQILKRLYKKYFETKNVIERIVDKVGGPKHS